MAVCNVMVMLALQLLDAIALSGRERVEVLVVVVGVVPDGAEGVGFGVDEELVVGFGVVGAHPAFGKRTELVFHAQAGRGRNAIVSVVVVAGDVEEVVGVDGG